MALRLSSMWVRLDVPVSTVDIPGWSAANL
jgi:hypothetical protein